MRSAAALLALTLRAVADPDHDDCVLSTPPDDARVLHYRADLAGVRAFAAAAARQAGLLPGRARDFVIAVSELAANTLAHTKGPGTLTAWSTRHELIGQVLDTGHITGPHPRQAGHRRPRAVGRPPGLRPGADPHRPGRDRHRGLHAPEPPVGGLTLRPVPPGPPGDRERGRLHRRPRGQRAARPGDAAVPAGRAAGLRDLRAAAGISLVQRQTRLPVPPGYTSATGSSPDRPKNLYVREDQILPRLAAPASLARGRRPFPAGRGMASARSRRLLRPQT